MNFIKIKSDEDFLNELNFCKDYFVDKKLSQGVKEIKNWVDDIYDIVTNQKIMIYKQKGYSNLRPFEDSYQDAIDFFSTNMGERVKQILYYFSNNYIVPPSQLGGYNIDKNYKESIN